MTHIPEILISIIIFMVIGLFALASRFPDDYDDLD